MAYTPKRLRPSHLLMIRLYWQGETIKDIAVKTDYTPQMVSNIVNSPEAEALIEQLTADTLDTMSQVQTDAQFMAPALYDELVKMAFAATDERVRLHAITRGLDMAGHVAVRRVTIERADALQKKYEGKSEEELRGELLGELTPLGPDGKMLQ